MKAFLVDFDDSFTLNVYCELKELGVDVEVVESSRSRDFLGRADAAEKFAVVLGPGPGSPQERADLFPAIEALLKSKSAFVTGICLGHQLIASSLDMKVVRSARPCHGEVETVPLTSSQRKWLEFDRPRIEAQRYNSLAVPIKGNEEAIKRANVKVLEFNGEIQAMRGPNFVSYQFHPESTGTSFRKDFFRPLRSFLL